MISPYITCVKMRKDTNPADLSNYESVGIPLESRRELKLILNLSFVPEVGKPFQVENGRWVVIRHHPAMDMPLGGSETPVEALKREKPTPYAKTALAAVDIFITLEIGFIIGILIYKYYA